MIMRTAGELDLVGRQGGKNRIRVRNLRNIDKRDVMRQNVIMRLLERSRNRRFRAVEIPQGRAV
jgi:hypothetical protein